MKMADKLEKKLALEILHRKPRGPISLFFPFTGQCGLCNVYCMLFCFVNALLVLCDVESYSASNSGIANNQHQAAIQTCK